MIHTFCVNVITIYRKKILKSYGLWAFFCNFALDLNIMDKNKSNFIV